MTEDTRNLVAFLATLLAIVALSKVGGTGSDLAIMTGLVGVLGMLARPARAQSPEQTGEPQPVTVVNPPSDPVNTEESRP